MNQFFYESRGREKIKDLMREGQVSQALRKSRVTKPEVQSYAPKHVAVAKLALSLLGIFGILSHRGH